MTKPIPTSDLARITELVRALCQLSKYGWQNAKPDEYLPLERELLALENQHDAAEHIDGEIDRERLALIQTGMRKRLASPTKDVDTQV